MTGLFMRKLSQVVEQELYSISEETILEVMDRSNHEQIITCRFSNQFR